MSHFSDFSALSPSTPYPSSGNVILGGRIIAVLQAAGGFLWLLKNSDLIGRGDPVASREDGNGKNGAMADFKPSKLVSRGLGYGVGIITVSIGQGGAASLLLNRVTSLVCDGWEKMKMDGTFPAMLAAILPPLETSLRKRIPECNCNATGDSMKEGFRTELCDPKTMVSRLQFLNMQDSGTVMEPKTGVHFPLHLSCDEFQENMSCQVLAGVGVRSKAIIKLKSINIYAFGVYVQPDHLVAQLGEKYKGIPPEVLRDQPEFFNDLLRHEVDMTVRLVVHYKGLNMGMVRSAFQDSLGNRIKKIAGSNDDHGLHMFCSYLSDDIRLFKGSAIDIRWQPGGLLRMGVGGREIGAIHSPHLCRAFFDLYIGDPPVCKVAKQSIGENVARLLQTSC